LISGLSQLPNLKVMARSTVFRYKGKEDDPQKIGQVIVGGEYAVSFVAPKYVLEYVDERMVGQMIQKTVGPVRYALVDWKGLGPHKDKIMRAVSRYGLEVVRL
jgi:D-aminoacyl-tRNA deacylase